MRPYCTQNNGDCETCALVNYRRDCRNNPLNMGTYIIGMEAGNLVGWTPETLTDALEAPLASVGIAVECIPRASGRGLVLQLDVDTSTADWLRDEVKRLVDQVIQEGE